MSIRYIFLFSCIFLLGACGPKSDRSSGGNSSFGGVVASCNDTTECVEFHGNSIAGLEFSTETDCTGNGGVWLANSTCPVENSLGICREFSGVHVRYYQGTGAADVIASNPLNLCPANIGSWEQ